MIIHIKNMVCPRCMMVVEKLLSEMELGPVAVKLGVAELSVKELQLEQKTALETRLQQSGFGLLHDPSTVTVEQIKNVLISHIHYATEDRQAVNWSYLLSQHLHRDYSYLSKLFSESEGITIEQYIIRQKIERVKELLQNNELTLSQIAMDMQYSSTAHLSGQFKKITGLTPSQYKQQAHPQRTPLDGI